MTPYRRRPYVAPTFVASKPWPGGSAHLAQHYDAWRSLHLEAEERTRAMRADRHDGLGAIVVGSMFAAGLARTVWEWLS